VIFELAVPTAIVVDYSRLRPLRSPWCSYVLPGICGDERELRVRGFPGGAIATRVFELYVCGGLCGGAEMGCGGRRLEGTGLALPENDGRAVFGVKLK